MAGGMQRRTSLVCAGFAAPCSPTHHSSAGTAALRLPLLTGSPPWRIRDMPARRPAPGRRAPARPCGTQHRASNVSATDSLQLQASNAASRFSNKPEKEAAASMAVLVARQERELQWYSRSTYGHIVVRFRLRQPLSYGHVMEDVGKPVILLGHRRRELERVEQGVLSVFGQSKLPWICSGYGDIERHCVFGLGSGADAATVAGRRAWWREEANTRAEV